MDIETKIALAEANSGEEKGHNRKEQANGGRKKSKKEKTKKQRKKTVSKGPKILAIKEFWVS